MTNKNVKQIKDGLNEVAKFFATSEIFRQLSDTKRLQIFWILCHQEESVINIAKLLDMTSPAVFHHLRILHDNELITSRRDGKEVYYKMADTIQCELLHKTVEQVMEIACPKNFIDYNSSLQEIICDIHEYLLTHLANRVSIKDLSKQFLMNPTTLKKVFKEVYGTSLATHMREHRMEKAKELLLNSNMNIAEIALTVGYESQSRFTSTFKKIYGILPTKFRKKL